MNYLLRVSDALNKHLVVFTLPDDVVRLPAADVVFDVIGAPQPESLIDSGQLSQEHLEDLRLLQGMIFGHDRDGAFIKDSITFKANGNDLDPDAPLSRGFIASEREGMRYMRMDLSVIDTNAKAPASGGSAPAQGQPKTLDEQMTDLGLVMLLHQIAIGFAIDVTKEYLEIQHIIARAEKEELIEIDVKKAAYKLTEKGKRVHESYIAEAQDLIKRFDIFGDVDFEPATGRAHFDTNLGRDLRVAAFEMEGVDPFRARFLLGINDGEWDKQTDWLDRIGQESWYQEIFAPIEEATSVAEIGHENMQAILQQGKTVLRQDSRLNS